MRFEITVDTFSDEAWDEARIREFTEKVTDFITGQYSVSVDVDYYK